MELTATSAWVVIAFDLALAGLGWTNCLAGRLRPGFGFTVEFGNDTVGRQNMPSVNSVFDTFFSLSLSDCDLLFSDCLSLSDGDSLGTTSSCLLD